MVNYPWRAEGGAGGAGGVRGSWNNLTARPLHTSLGRLSRVCVCVRLSVCATIQVFVRVTEALRRDPRQLRDARPGKGSRYNVQGFPATFSNGGFGPAQHRSLLSGAGRR